MHFGDFVYALDPLNFFEEHYTKELSLTYPFEIPATAGATAVQLHRAVNVST